MKRLGSVSFFLAASWSWSLSFRAEARLEVSAILVLAAFLLTPSSRSGHVARPTWIGALLGALLAGVGALVPFPYSLGIYFLAAACLLHGFVRRAAEKLAWTGWILCVQAVVVPATIYLFLLDPSLPGLDQATAALFRLFGIAASAENGMLFVTDQARTVSISVVPEKLGFFVAAPFLLSLALVAGLTRRDRFSWPGVLARIILTVAYLVARFLVVTMLYFLFRDVELFWSRWLETLTLLPLGLFWDRGASARPTCPLCPGPRCRAVPATALGALAVAAGALFFTPHDPGERKRGRVLVDEVHSKWEWTTEPFDTKRFGQRSTYNYYCWARWLGYSYDLRRNETGCLDAERLRDVDVLVLKTPTQPYSPEEVETFRSFVEKGGGLVLIGDHTNLYGMSTYLNAVAGPFGFRFRFDDTFSLGTGAPTDYVALGWGLHPILNGLDRMRFQTSCTIEVSSPAVETAMLGERMAAEYVDYGHRNFFGNITYDPEDRFGVFYQAVTVRYGRGRVVAFSDSTIFSNFNMPFEGVPELSLGLVEYANRTNAVPPWSKQAFGIAALVLATALTLLSLSGRARPAPVWLVFIGALAALVVCGVVGAEIRKRHRVETDGNRFTRVSIDRSHTNVLFPGLILDRHQRQEDSYSTFAAWLQRLPNVVSMLRPDLESCLRDGDATVLLLPSRAFSPEEREAIVRAVRRGHTLIVMDAARNGASTADRVLAPFGMRLQARPQPVSAHRHLPVKRTEYLREWTLLEPVELLLDREEGIRLPSAGEPVGRYADIVLTVEGGTPLRVTRDGRVLAAQTSFGRGRVVAVVDAVSFSNRMLGGLYEPEHETDRSEENRALFDLFRSILPSRDP